MSEKSELGKWADEIWGFQRLENVAESGALKLLEVAEASKQTHTESGIEVVTLETLRRWCGK